MLGLGACAGLTPVSTAAPDPATVALLERSAPNDCNPSVASVLAGAGIPAAAIRDVTYGLYRDEFSDRIVRYDAWVYLTDQPGAIVVAVDRDCRPIQIYARDGARMPNRRP
ncbi:hypothetical protein DEW08_21385 (plasmid) [Azospirillum thermophilum]|uniref:Uncharacterized protein n=1 Tax=Azospirillum thermophilum TaxID=2202148 RepID=A0A2S2CXP1_9PROT|nr:hypothetical protein DEW08_21385 [Azospirillum thermophilum]